MVIYMPVLTCRSTTGCIPLKKVLKKDVILSSSTDKEAAHTSMRVSSSSSSSKRKQGVPWRTQATRRSLLFLSMRVASEKNVLLIPMEDRPHQIDTPGRLTYEWKEEYVCMSIFRGPVFTVVSVDSTDVFKTASSDQLDNEIRKRFSFITHCKHHLKNSIWCFVSSLCIAWRCLCLYNFHFSCCKSDEFWFEGNQSYRRLL
jgi:hypothetical protein